MEHHEHPVLTVAVFLGAGVATGVASVSIQEIDIYLAITLKIISIISFIVATCYALWKWRADFQNTKIVNEVMNDYQEKKQQKSKKLKK